MCEKDNKFTKSTPCGIHTGTEKRINTSTTGHTCTNSREEEGLVWPFTPSQAVHNRGVDNVRKRQQIYKEYSMRYTHN